jgi:tRNA threonylcarbamoyladenosine biosynthesis protein TsaE
MDNSLELTVTDLSGLKDAASSILKFCGEDRIFLFDAPMGAGKTTLIKELCGLLGSSDSFSSPTYSIVNEYQARSGKIFHFDLYRLKNEAELMDLGIEEYLDSRSYCFIEWPDLARPLLEQPFVEIKISMLGEVRTISCKKQ